jgi:hypothetical protein
MDANTRMLWIIIIVLVAAVAASSAGCTSNQTQSPTPGVPASFLLYTNKDAGVEMHYPSDWQVTGNSGGSTIATFQRGNDGISLMIQRLSLNQSGKTPQSLAPSLISSLQKSNSSFSLLENHTASLGDLPGYEVVFTLKGPDAQPYKGLVIWTVKGNSVYEIQFTGIAAQYDAQIATAQQMVSSFKLT